jgi:hypothetical protein
MYWHVFHWVLVISKFKFDPYKIVQDFEKAMINVGKDQFPDTEQDGCLFHCKQA